MWFSQTSKLERSRTRHESGFVKIQFCMTILIVEMKVYEIAENYTTVPYKLARVDCTDVSKKAGIFAVADTRVKLHLVRRREHKCC